MAEKRPEGVRIQHPSEKDCVFTMVDGKRPYQEPYDCPVCHRVHTFKTYHFTLDSTGAAIVSEEIAERIKAIHGQPFAITGAVSEPPAQRIVVHPQRRS